MKQELTEVHKNRILVPGAGVEPARPYGQGIFVPATAFAAAHLSSSRAHLWSGLSLYPIDGVREVSRRATT